MANLSVFDKNQATIQWNYPKIVGRFSVAYGNRPALPDSPYKDSHGIEWFLKIHSVQSGLSTVLHVVGQHEALNKENELLSVLGD